MRQWNVNIFSKVFILILVLLAPIMALYTYSYQTSLSLIERYLKKDSLDSLIQLTRQVDTVTEQLSSFSIMFLSDPQAQSFRDIHLFPQFFNTLALKTDISNKLLLQLTNYGGNVHFALYSPASQDTIAVNSNFTYTQDYFTSSYTNRWKLQTRSGTSNNEREQKLFVRHFSMNPNSNGISESRLIIEAGINADLIADLLTNQKQPGSDPFLYIPGQAPLLNRTSNTHMVAVILSNLSFQNVKPTGNSTITIDKEEYLINYSYSKTLQGYLVNYVPLSGMVSPVVFNRNLFYTATALLLAAGMIASFLLYRHVQVPIRDLIHGVQRLKRGDFSARVTPKQNNEFRYLFDRFNEMASQIEQLIHNVYEEKLRSREATVKQLQAQINPHFLYNCLFFIKNMARIGDEEAVVKMTLHLGEYFRYTTRVEQQITSLGNELKLVDNYLAIQQLRMKRIRYQIDVPEEMQQLQVPRLIVQPIVENAVIHGIEPNPEAGEIRLTGEQTVDGWRLHIEDDGSGMSEQQLEELRNKMNQPLSEDTGCGTWNVNQRLIHLFGEQAGAQFTQAPGGGLRVTLFFPIPSPNQA